jgi:energy-coupling factor transporter ATP-binding protein EcfA2
LISRTEILCRQLKPVLGTKIDRLWKAYLSESDMRNKADIEQTLELLAAKHLGKSFEPDRSPFPPPPKTFSQAGDIKLGMVSYGNKDLYPFYLKSSRLKEHIIVAGRSGSGKTNTVFVLMEGMMNHGIKILALDWKRGYRDLLSRHKDLQIFTIGRTVSPFRFNPLIPPTGCEPNLWIKLIVDVIANSYLGGEGVISLLVAGMDHLYRQYGIFDGRPTRWPTISDLLAWLQTTRLKGRAALWQASAERILLAMSYGEFGEVLNTQDNSHIAQLLDHNVILEMDGLSSASDKVMFSEALTLYLYRYRLSQGPQKRLTNMIILEEAHNLLLKKSDDTRESILETTIRMIRQYGLGYVFVDQSASLLSKVAFANSYATLGLSQKLRSDVMTMASSMNLTDEQKDAMNTLPIGTAVVRLADEYPEAFLVKIPRFEIEEGCVSDHQIREQMAGYYTDTALNKAPLVMTPVISPIPGNDNIYTNSPKPINPRPPSPNGSELKTTSDTENHPPRDHLNREEVRFIWDIVNQSLSTTVSRYQRLNLSRRKGNAIKDSLLSAGIIEAVVLATRSGQVVLYQLTDNGRQVCLAHQIDPGPVPRESLEHRWWVGQARHYFEKKGYEATLEHPIQGNGAVDLLAVRPGETIVVEVETGKSDIKANLSHIKRSHYDKMIMIATSPEAVSACQKAIDQVGHHPELPAVELLTWLDIS